MRPVSLCRNDSNDAGQQWNAFGQAFSPRYNMPVKRAHTQLTSCPDLQVGFSQSTKVTTNGCPRQSHQASI